MSETPGRILELAVANLALIDRLRLRFEPGLNVLTGETGAGKSLVIDAGSRSAPGPIRRSSDTAPRPHGSRRSSTESRSR